jgi:hypothetical protein
VTPEQKKRFLAGYRCGRAHAAQSARWLARRLDDEAAAIVDIAEADADLAANEESSHRCSVQELP